MHLGHFLLNGEQQMANKKAVDKNKPTRKTIVRSHVEEYLQNCIKRYNLSNQDNPIRKK